MTQSNFQIGQVVKYSKPVDQDEKNARFIVREITPPDGNLKEKLTVVFVCDNYLKPVSCFFSEEFEKA